MNIQYTQKEDNKKGVYMQYKISSGNGPAECELAVTKFHQYLCKNYSIKEISKSQGYNKDTFRSVSFETEHDLSEFIGSVQWICKSQYRPGHKRKNWFINFLIVHHSSDITFDENKVVFERFHSGGNGGQNVNKVETGIRAIYTPTGDSTSCTDERSQLANKKKAVARLKEIIQNKNTNTQISDANNSRIDGVQIERGNAVATFEGMNFKRI